MPEQYWIPIGLFAAALYSFYRGYLSYKSGSKYQDRNGKWIESDIPPSWYSVTGFVFGLGLLIASIGSFFWMWSER